jgi:phenylpropionate dioxygenase-like ring-hydroxylating dioxygenase large terminal subunit
MDPPTTPIAMDIEVTRELVDHIRNGTTVQAPSQLKVPIEHFTSKKHLEAEIALMKRLPLVVGHVCEIKNPRDFITRTVFDTPLIIVRQSDGSVATYRNMCRHRGGVVEREASGNKRLFACRYHGWTYDAEGGALKRVIYERVFGTIDYARSGLLRIKTEVRHGLIFITFNPDQDASSLADYFGPEVDAQFAPWSLENGVLFLDKTFTRAMNWKLVMDGAVDPLHPHFLHSTPGGVGSRTVNNTAVFRALGRHGRMFMGRAKLKNLVQAGETLEASTKYVSSIMMVYPNVLWSTAPDHIEFWTVWPTVDNPGECTIKIRFFVRPEIMSAEMTARINKSWAILEQAALEEDFPMELAIQHNGESLPDGVFTYGLNEYPPQHLHRQLAKDLAKDAG